MAFSGEHGGRADRPGNEHEERPGDRGRRASRSRFARYKRMRRELPPSERVSPLLEAEHPTRRRRRQRSFVELAVALWGLIKGHRVVAGAALVTLTVATGLSLALPMSTKVAIDYILTDNPGPDGLPEALPRDRVTLLWLLSGAMVAITAASILVGIWGRWQMTRITKLLQVMLRRRAFQHAVRLPLHRVQSLKSGGVASVLREDAGGAAELLFSMVYNPWRAIVQLVGTMVILALVDWRLLLGAILLLPTVWVTHRAWIARIRPMWRDIRSTRQGIDAHATEVFGGMRVVRGFGRQPGESSRFAGENHLMARQEVNTWWWSRGLEIVWQALIPIASSGVLLYGGYQVVHGNLSVGDVMMFSAYLLTLLGPIEALVSTATNIQNNLAGFDRVLDLFEEEREFDGVGEGIQISREQVHGRISIEGVRFTYPGSSEEVLSNVWLEASPGETIALVGVSGSGKTTLCNLVARFYDPTGGRICLDGTDLRDLDVESYRRVIGIVEQDVFLFDGTIAQNIAYARRDATPEMVEHAARAANAASFIEGFDRGYDTLVGERGVRLSGGQKQRIAIARAVLADPRILILDEATSNLDSESELLIQRSLRRLMEGRTSFVIAHRLSTIRHADRIAVLEAGELVEIGSHDELQEQSGRYAELLRMQLGQGQGTHHGGVEGGVGEPA